MAHGFVKVVSREIFCRAGYCIKVRSDPHEAFKTTSSQQPFSSSRTFRLLSIDDKYLLKILQDDNQKHWTMASNTASPEVTQPSNNNQIITAILPPDDALITKWNDIRAEVLAVLDAHATDKDFYMVDKLLVNWLDEDGEETMYTTILVTVEDAKASQWRGVEREIGTICGRSGLGHVRCRIRSGLFPFPWMR